MVQLQEFFVLSSSGVPIITFSKDDSNKLNENLLAVAISSVSTFCSAFSDKKIKGFNVGNYKFTCVPALNDEILLVCKTDVNDKKKDLEKMCNVLGKIFEDIFSIENLRNWDGDISFFDKFRNRLDIYFRVGAL